MTIAEEELYKMLNQAYQEVYFKPDEYHRGYINALREALVRIKQVQCGQRID